MESVKVKMSYKKVLLSDIKDEQTASCSDVGVKRVRINGNPGYPGYKTIYIFGDI